MAMPFTMQPMVQAHRYMVSAAHYLATEARQIVMLDDLSIGTAGVCAISADRETGILSGGADPCRSARAMGF